MRVPTSVQAFSAASAIAILAACSGGSAIVPKLTARQNIANYATRRMPSILSPMGSLNFNFRALHHFKSFYACPTTGSLKYVSDFTQNVINVYTGNFAGQAPCGRITSRLSNPRFLFVQPATHDLYVANATNSNILVFHRGQSTPYNSYSDPTGQYPWDVTVAKDGTVIASNDINTGFNELGSISTWIGGPNGGTFVGNFPMTNSAGGLYVTVQKSGKVYFTDIDATTLQGVLWSMSCPAGACGLQTQVAGVSFQLPGDMGSDDTEDLLVNDSDTGKAETFELPNPVPSTFPVVGTPYGMAINPLDHHWFLTDPTNNNAAEYKYPGGRLIGTVPGDPSGQALGIAVDPGHAL
jgi:hypothetical protein